jgi:hypothetical protein
MILRRIVTLVFPAALLACQSAGTTTSPAPAASAKPAAEEKKKEPEAPPPPVGPVAREFEVKTPAGNTAKLKATVPSDWKPSAFGYGMKDEYGETIAGVEGNVTCDGSCTEPDLSANLAKLVERSPESASKPNYNTGDPKLDAVRLDVAKLESGDFPDGKWVLYKVTKPAGLEGPYREHVRATCARLHPGKDRFVVLSAWAPAAKEKELGPVILAACKSLEVLP